MQEKETQIQFVDPFSVLVINAKGYIRQVFTPFRVQCLLQTDHIPANAWVYVDCVYEDKEKLLIYLVGGKLYPYWCFRIQILF
jgi:hypothetical protein